MGIRSYVMTDTGEDRHTINGKGINNFQMGLWSYCHAVEAGEPMDDYIEWYRCLEAAGENSLCAISKAFRRSMWHDQAIFAEDEYERWVKRYSGYENQRLDLSYEAFVKELDDYQATYLPVADLAEDVRRIVERIKQVNPPENLGFYDTEYVLPDLEDLLSVLMQAKADGVVKACLMMG